MFGHSFASALAWMICLTLAASTPGATYYIDFAGGDDTADGLSPQAPWKHAPGDPQAAGAPAAASLAPGDTLIFRGGVAYHGTISLAASGAADKPITLDGNTAGTFGEGRAVIDGGRVIKGWQRCQSARQAQGNPRWRDIFFADVEVDLTPNVSHGQFAAHRQVSRDRQAPWQRVILIDGERRLLPIAQQPKPADAFYPDLPGDFFQTPQKLEVRAEDDLSLITDPAHLTAEDPAWYDGMFVGVHGGNNHVYFARVKGYKPETHQLVTPAFRPSLYSTTRYALYNSPRLIELPGEWAVESLGEGRSRVYLLAENLVDGQPFNIGYPEYLTGVSIDKGASHIRVKGFLIQRYSGGNGGVSISRSNERSKDVAVSDCEIRFVSGHAGIGLNYCDDILVENCYIHHCPAWTTGVFLSRVSDYAVRNCYLEKNSGSGIRHYECHDGLIAGNAVLEHFGMHSSGINVYEGCSNLVLEGNYIHHVVTINRNAENIIFRNNVIDGLGRSSVCLGIWGSGRTGGRAVKNIQFLNNTFVNINRATNWSTGILGQRGRNVSAPEGLVVRNNILDRVTDDLKGVFENNIYLREVEPRFMGAGCEIVADPQTLFLDMAKGDFRRRPGGPRPEAGAMIAPPPAHPAGF